MLDTVNTTELATDNTNTTAVTSFFGTAGDTAGNIQYDPFAPNQVAAQYALEDVQTIKPRTRDEYVGLFKRTEERTARATLQMCRVVYEAKQTLKEHEFADFCSTVGYKDTSATIRASSAPSASYNHVLYNTQHSCRTSGARFTCLLSCQQNCLRITWSSSKIFGG